MEQGKAEEHMNNDCEYTEIACAYKSLGCKVNMLRKDRVTHEKEDKEKHLYLSLTTIRLLSERNKTLTERMENHERLEETVHLQDEQLKILTEKNNTLSEGEAVIFKLQGYTS